MVVYFCGSTIRYESIPKALWEDVDACIAAGNEILAGNGGFGHRVYGRCKNSQYENASVYKTIKPHSILCCAEKLVKKCDRMVAVWDGESQEVLMNILLLLALQKKCRLYYLPSDSCVEISSVDEMEPLVPEREEWTPEFIRKVLKTCGFSKEMMEHILRRGRLTKYVMADVVCRAPIPLKNKHELLDVLIKRNNTNFKTFVKAAEAIKAGDYDAVREAVMDAFVRMDVSLYDAFNECTLAELGLKHYTYYLFDEWYDPDVLMKRSHPCGMFGTFKQAKDYIMKDMEWKRKDADVSWYRIEAWNLDAWDKYEHAYNYYVYNGEICWFERMKVCREKNGYEYYVPEEGRFCGGDIDLCMSSPFKAGDIVNIDCRPFGPPLHALVVQGWSQYECRFPLVLFKVPFTDTWRISLSYFKHFYKDANGYYYEPKLSPLYRLRSVGKDELTEEDELLVKVSKWIGGDEERGAALWKAWNENYVDERTAEGVEEILRLSASIGDETN